MAATYTARNDGMRGGTVEREKALEVALLQIEKQLGKGLVMRRRTARPTRSRPSSTGSLALDLALGIGKAARPRGRDLRSRGLGQDHPRPAHHRRGLKAGGIAAFVDAEHALDVTYARNLGVNTDELLTSQPDTGECGPRDRRHAGPLAPSTSS